MSLATSERPTLVPVVLGCCPDPPRCALCPPPPRPPAVDTVSALLQHYASERAPVGGAVHASFFGGAPPADELLDALGGRPFRVRVRPDLLDRAGAERLVRRGCTAVELDALTFDDAALRGVGRRYSGRRVRQMAGALRAMALRVGVVLAPGLPDTDFATARADAELAAELFDTARLHPVLVLQRSGLRELHSDGLYAPLGLGAAITVCVAMLEILEGAGVDVIRVGVQPGPDGLGRAVAGPRHPAFRQLVDARRVLRGLRVLLDGTPPGAHVVIQCAPADETVTRGPHSQHIRTLRAEFELAGLRIRARPGLRRGTWTLEPGP